MLTRRVLQLLWIGLCIGFTQPAMSETADLNAFKQQVMKEVRRSMVVPAGTEGSLRTSVKVKLDPSMRVVDVSVIKSSGDDAYDQAVVQGVRKIGQFPAKPEGADMDLFRNIILNIGLQMGETVDVSVFKQQVMKEVRRSMVVPLETEGSLRTSVKVKLDPAMRVLRVSVIKSSGDEAYDQAVVQSVRSIGQFPPRPEGADMDLFRNIILNIGSPSR